MGIQRIFQFGIIQFMIAANQYRHRFFIDHINEGFYQLLRPNIQKRGDLFNGSLIRRIHPGQRLKAVGIRHGRIRFLHLRPFQVGGVIAGRAIDDLVLAGLGQHHEFVGIAPPDAPGVGFNRPEFQSTPLKDPVIRLVHGLITLIGPILIHIKTVGILHNEFTATHNPETGPDLIPEFGLDLVKVDGHLLVGVNLFSHQVGDHLFVGGPHAGIPVVAVLEAQQFTAIIFPPATLLPQFSRLHGGHEDLDGPCPVHLLPDNILHLPDGPEANGKIGVNARGQFSNHTGPDHQLVADDLGIGRDFLFCGNKIAGISHNLSTFSVMAF